MGEWQVMQPRDLRSASSPDWPLWSFEAGRAAENPVRLANKSAIEMQENAAIGRLRFLSIFQAVLIIFRLIALEDKLHGTEQRKKGLANVDVAKAVTGSKQRCSPGQDDVFRQ